MSSRRKVHLFVREHQSRWHTASMLTLPRYCAYGPHLSALREEIADALAEDLERGELMLRGDTYFEKLIKKTLSIELLAVQHEHLITVPMRFTVLYRALDEGEETFEVRIPRLQELFRIRGSENIDVWAEQVIRGHFHLKSVDYVLRHQFERSEKLEVIEVGAAKLKKEKRLPRVQLELEGRVPAHPLDSYGSELVAEAQAGHLSRAQLREDEVNELRWILKSERTQAALLIGPSGIGKTAIVQALAHQIAGQEAFGLDGAKVWNIPASRIVAGARFLGEWQERCRFVVETVRSAADVLYMGSLGELFSIHTHDGGLGMSEFLLPSIESGDLKLILEATPDALSLAESRNPAFVRALQHLPIASLPASSVNTILEKSANELGREHKIEWEPGAISGALDVVARFGDAGSLPGSGLSLLEAMVRMKSGKRGKIGKSDAIRAFAQLSGFPEGLLDPAQKLDVEEVRRFFRSRVVGQDRATDLLAQVILLLKAGLNDPQKPLGSFLFAGPTGVGKTESALTLAEYLFGDRQRLVRLDMSEYGYPGSALRLVEGPGGQGELTKRIREQPFSVILLDEIEKADSGVFDLLLQVLGEGRLTDGTGRTVSFAHAVVIMTSNLGADRKQAIGFEDRGTLASDSKYREAVERFFRPELVNRIDHVVPFRALDRTVVEAIARKLLEAAIAREGFQRRKWTVRFDESVVRAVAERGFDPRYGARPLKRAVEELVIAPLARGLSKDGESVAREVSVSFDGELLVS
jgi:ATP-dependent Clp protease ATP-binding subunit ClpC